MCRPKKRGEEARGFSTVRGAPQNGDGRVEADFAIMRLTAQPGHKICILYYNYQITGCPDVDVVRIGAADRPKTSTASKATLSICLRTKLVA